MKKKTQTYILPALREMKPGETRLWPIERIASVRAIINRHSLEASKTFKTKSNRANQTLSVTRIS